MPSAWDTVVADLARDFGEITGDLGRAEKLVRSSDVLDPARQAEREAASAINRAIDREGIPNLEMELTVREARAAVARAKELIASLTAEIGRSRRILERAREETDRASESALRLREQFLRARRKTDD